MKTCSCGGEFLRHGITRYKCSDMVGVRYICRECRKSHTERFKADSVEGVLFFNATGRPTLKDWRYRGIDAKAA